MGVRLLRVHTAACGKWLYQPVGALLTKHKWALVESLVWPSCASHSLSERQLVTLPASGTSWSGREKALVSVKQHCSGQIRCRPALPSIVPSACHASRFSLPNYLPSFWKVLANRFWAVGGSIWQVKSDETWKLFFLVTHRMFMQRNSLFSRAVKRRGGTVSESGYWKSLSGNCILRNPSGKGRVEKQWFSLN